MKRRIAVEITAMFLAAACQGEKATPETAAVDPRPIVVFETSLGPIELELDRDHAPETVKHFLTHVHSGFYNGVVVHRVEAGFVIQIGGWQPDGRERKTSAFPVANENPNSLSNLRGTISMARTNDPHSGLVDFFINLVDNRDKLDFRDSSVAGFGYVVFGKVVEGMDVVDSIARLPIERKGRRLRSYPVETPVIERAYVRENDTDS